MEVSLSVGSASEVHLSEQSAVVSEVEAVVSGEYDGGLVLDAHILDFS